MLQVVNNIRRYRASIERPVDLEREKPTKCVLQEDSGRRAAVAIWFMYYHFCRMHPTLRVTQRWEVACRITFGLSKNYAPFFLRMFPQRDAEKNLVLRVLHLENSCHDWRTRKSSLSIQPQSQTTKKALDQTLQHALNSMDNVFDPIQCRTAGSTRSCACTHISRFRSAGECSADSF
jgi:hypothetical protein